METGGGDAARVALPFIKCLAIKDAHWEQVPGRGWTPEFVPIGEGLVDFRSRFELLKSAGFSGPVNIHFEHHGLLGTNVGTWKPAMRAAQVP